MYAEIFSKITDLNMVTTTISIITIAILVFNNAWLKPRLAKKLSIPIPIELILVVGGTLISSYVDLNSNWSVKLLGNIPKGLPTPDIPEFSLAKSLIFESFAVAMVSFSASVSIALILAKKFQYEIDFNQELLAMVRRNFNFIIANTNQFFPRVPVTF